LLGNVRNNLSLSVNGNNRDDKFSDRFNSDQMYFGAGVTSRFPIPVTSKVTYYQYESVIGQTTQTTSTTNHLGLQLNYKLNNIIQNDELQPFVRLGLQKMETSTYNSDRTNYVGGLLYRNPVYGIMTFEYSYYAFKLPSNNLAGLRDYNNTIIRATYGYNF
jgi:hypothetical protein